ncbi:hypothetical protein J1N35_008598 [Gossypium stocksii]|uniref:Reverse transcriptase domain-containing protein n=1 Tax=Gossypium stocksii TaxID=47602 RepID=A0A9D3WAM5_9ROSI|nr:hypothetical protein J1N35_008598 [Gossypium stocksii]
MVLQCKDSSLLRVFGRDVCFRHIHLFYAWNDLAIAFIKPYMVVSDDLFSYQDQRALILKDVVKRFCRYFNHRINAQKTDIYFFKGTDNDNGRQLSRIIRFHKVYNLGTYLGVPLLHKKILNSALRFIIDKVQNKLNRWDARKLSLASKATLA